MKPSHLVALFLTVSFFALFSAGFVAAKDNDGGGVECITCTLVVALMEQYAGVHDTSIDQTVEKWCSFLPSALRQPCDVFVLLYGKEIIDNLQNNVPADDVCAKIKICTNPSQCRLFPPPKSSVSFATTAQKKETTINIVSEASDNEEARVKKVVDEYMLKKKQFEQRREQMLAQKQGKSKSRTLMEAAQQKSLDTNSGFGSLFHKLMASLKKLSPVKSIWEDIIKKIDKVANEHLPFSDIDSDKFSAEFGLRGSAWRGRDCSDLDPTIYPGRRATTLTPAFDHNCNGIDGEAPSGQSYEDLLCKGTGQRGTIIIGDSATAHFRIPPQWLTAADIDEKIFANALHVLENEMDWPQLSWSTAHEPSDPWDLTPGPVDSFYLRMRARNLCNHRDYQNIGVNGARSGALIKISETVSRNRTVDHPAVVFYAPIGNDVCTPHHTTNSFTTPTDFYNNVLATVQYLNATLPDGSLIVFLGLVDGRILFDTLHNVKHPIGTTYERVYDFLNCLHSNPCWGWLNSNATLRNETTAHAELLSSQYVKLISDWQPRIRIPMLYYPFPLPALLKAYTAAGGNPIDLIEPVDGFHPSQITNSLMGAYLFEAVAADRPDLLGAVNPNNDLIASVFGDQGGY